MLGWIREILKVLVLPLYTSIEQSMRVEQMTSELAER